MSSSTDIEPAGRKRGLTAPSAATPACWNHAGVYGAGDCPELVKHIHCRNCPVYARASGELLDRPLPADYRQEWTEHLMERKQLAAQTDTSALVFRIGPEWLALPTQAFQEVAEWRPIHSLPHRRRGTVLGLANFRGELLICVTLGHLLGIDGLQPPEALRSRSTRLLVARWQDGRYGFPVDEVQGIHRFASRNLKAPPATLGQNSPAYTRGLFRWRDLDVGFLDASLVFTALNRSLT